MINTVMALISLLTPLCYTRRITNGIAVYIAVVTIILDLAKVVHMAALQSADGWEIVIMIASYLLLGLYFGYVDATHVKVYAIVPALLVTIATGTIETFRDVYTAAYNDRDGSDCLFI